MLSVFRKIKINLMRERNETGETHKEISNIYKPECKQLPTTEINSCAKSGLFTKVLAFYKLIFDRKNGIVSVTDTLETEESCISIFFGETIINKLVAWGVEKLLSLVSNLFGLFVFKIIKAVFYAILIVNNIYHAFNEIKIEEKSEYWGKAVGNVFNFVMVIATGRKKRKMRKFK